MTGKSAKPPIILFYDHTAKLSGGEISLLHLVTHMHRDQFTPVVVLGEDGPLRTHLEAANIETHILPLDSGISKTSKDSLGGKGLLLKLGAAGRFWRYVWKLARFIRRHRAAVVHTNSLKSDIIGGLAGRLARRPVIWHVRDCIDGDYLPGAAVKIFRLACRRLPTHIIAISKAVQDTLCLPDSRAVTVVHNGAPASNAAFQPSSQRKYRVVGMVGRITRWKGQHIFLEAAARLKDKYPDVRFQIIGAPLFGEESYEKELHGLVQALHLESVVEFLGFRGDIPQLMADLDILAHASTSAEPFGKVVIEAMIAGKPVVATNGGGIPDIVLDGETGYLVPMGDEAALAEGIEKLLANPDTATTMGQAGRARVLKHFTIERTVQGVEAIYGKLIQGK